MKTIPYLDGWRGVAILLVLLDHFGPARFWYAGRLGVVLFFVLSGLFMGRLLFIERVPLSSFFARRISRVIPALWAYVGAMWVYSKFLQPTPYDVGLGEMASVLTFTSTYVIDIWDAKWPIGQLWSLNVEEHAYVFLALLTLVVAKMRGKISASALLALTIAAVCTCICLYMSEIVKVTGSAWRTRSEVACLGLISSTAICVWREMGHMAWMKSKTLPLLALMIALISFYPRWHFSWNFSILIAPILFAFTVNYASELPEIIKKTLSLAPLRWFGQCSFSIYLWQGPFRSAVIQSGSSKPLCLMAGLFAGALSFYFIEKPARLYFNRKWDERVALREPIPVPAATV